MTKLQKWFYNRYVERINDDNKRYKEHTRHLPFNDWIKDIQINGTPVKTMRMCADSCKLPFG